jgi:hypothetical protein
MNEPRIISFLPAATEMVPPNRVLEAVKNGKHHFCSASSRVLTVRQGEKTVATAEDFEHEANAASGSLCTLAALHKAGDHIDRQPQWGSSRVKHETQAHGGTKKSKLHEGVGHTNEYACLVLGIH